MALFHSPKTATDGLVLMYDTGNSKSYRGEPTTNYGPASFGDWGTESTAERIATGNTFNGQPTYNCRTVVGQSYRGIEKTISGLRTAAGSSGTVTMSCMVRNNNATAYSMYAYIGHDFSSGISVTANSDWQKVQWTVNQSSMNNDYVEFRPYTNNANIYLEMTMPMVEVNKGHATQFVDGTRSTTQGLIDRTGNETITLSNVSFDSNAQMTFDGTDDYISISDPGVSTSFSIEVVIKVDNYSNGPIFVSPNSVGIDHFFRVLNTGKFSARFVEIADSSYDSYTSTTVIDTSKYYHVVISKSPTSGTIYVNGVAEDSHTPTLPAAAWSGVWYIGSRANNTYNFNGELPILKVYDRDLPAEEVLQNYNATKSRFGI